MENVQQFIFRNEPGDRYLGSVSNLMQNLFEYAESKIDSPAPTSPDPNLSPKSRARSASAVYENPHRPYVALSVFRMCILADPLMEEFFDSDLTNSWKLEVLIAEEKIKPAGPAGWLGGIVSAVLTDENKVSQCGARLNAFLTVHSHRNVSTASQTKWENASKYRQSRTAPHLAKPTHQSNHKHETPCSLLLQAETRAPTNLSLKSLKLLSTPCQQLP